MPTLKNTNPIGDVYVAAIGRDVAAGEEFDVTAEQAEDLLAQKDEVHGHANYQSVADNSNDSKDEG